MRVILPGDYPSLMDCVTYSSWDLGIKRIKASRKRSLASAKPKLKRNKFASDKLPKIGFRNPPEIEKTL